MPQSKHRVNKAIMAKEVRVIGEDARQLGIMPTHIAVRIAEEKGLDLVEVNPKVSPPVCKIIDHGRFKYEEARKKRQAKRKQNVICVKEVKLRPKTDKHDLAVKSRMVQRFLADSYPLILSVGKYIEVFLNFRLQVGSGWLQSIIPCP